MNAIEKHFAEMAVRHQYCTDDDTCATIQDDFIALLLALQEVEHRAPEHVPPGIHAVLKRANEADPRATHIALRELYGLLAKVPATVLVCKYLGQPKFLDHAFAALGRHFGNRAEFDAWYTAIPSDEDKDRFLRIVLFYRFLVLEGRFRFSDPSWTEMDYIDDTYKSVAIFALIEASYEKSECQEFYPWLRQRMKETSIASRDELDVLHEEYLAEHGSTQAVVRFFQALSDEDKRALRSLVQFAGGTQVPDETLAIQAIAKTLYKMRSEFVHRAIFVLELGAGTHVSQRGTKGLVTEMTLEDLKRLFEQGLIRRFTVS